MNEKKIVEWFYDHEELLLEIMDKKPYQSDGWDYEIEIVKAFLAQQSNEQDLSEQGRNRSAVIGNNVEAMMDAGLPFLKALETTLKVYDHDISKIGCVNHDCDKCKAQPEQEPVAWIDSSGHPKHLKYVQGIREKQLYGELKPLYTTPPQRTWVGLTDEEQRTIADLASANDWHDFDVMDATEAKLREKNT